MILKPVVLEKPETCLTYALKRIGAESLLPCDYEAMTSGMHFQVLGWNADEVAVGDLILWDRDLTKSLYPIEITTAGTIIHAYLPTGLHYGVCEGDGLFSDCVRDGDYPIIRLRKLSDCRPDRILRRCGG